MSKYITEHLQTVERWRKEQTTEQTPLINQTKKGGETQQPKIKIKR